MKLKIFHSKSLTICTLLFFMMLLSSDVLPERNVSVQSDVDRLIREGKELYENGEYEEAKDKFLEALGHARKREELSEVYFYLSLAYYANGQSEKAKENLLRLFEIQPDRIVDEWYCPSEFVEMFNETKTESRKLKEVEKKPEKPVVKTKPPVEREVKKGGGGGFIIVLVALAAGGVAAALLLSKKPPEEDEETNPTITVIDLPSGIVWTTGEEVEIKWETSGSGSSQGVVSTGAGLDPLIHHGKNVLNPFQRRAFQQRRFLRNIIKERRSLEDVDSSGNRGTLSSKTSKPQGISGESSSSAKEGDIVNKRAKDIRDIKRNSRVGIINAPVIPQISSGKFMPSGDIRVLGLSDVKIDLYKGSTFNQTIVESTENDGSYTWTVDPSLEDGTNYKVRISSSSDSTVYGESEEFEIRTIREIEWVQIPAGNFQMGDNFNEGESDELPVHTVYLDTYYISKYEVTFKEYDEFCDATGRTKPSDEGWGRGARPVINVSWADANAFCDWKSGETGENIYLPTEAQWEKAARGTDQRRYPWGNDSPDSYLANYNRNVEKTMPIGYYPSGVSPYGIHDMAGNVWEWCSDLYDANYYSSSPTNNPQGPSSGFFRVLRGGCWHSNAYHIRSAYRYSNFPPSYGRPYIGFRLCKD